MIKCKLCNKEFNNINGLSKHITNSHKEITKEEYYKKYINIISNLCVCGKEKKFRGMGEGYRTYCSVKCRSNNVTPINFWKGKKQPKEMIQKRINNTNQKQKQKNRENTLEKKYGNPKYNNKVRKCLKELSYIR